MHIALAIMDFIKENLRNIYEELDEFDKTEIEKVTEISQIVLQNQSILENTELYIQKIQCMLLYEKNSTENHRQLLKSVCLSHLTSLRQLRHFNSSLRQVILTTFKESMSFMAEMCVLQVDANCQIEKKRLLSKVTELWNQNNSQQSVISHLKNLISEHEAEKKQLKEENGMLKDTLSKTHNQVIQCF